MLSSYKQGPSLQTIGAVGVSCHADLNLSIHQGLDNQGGSLFNFDSLSNWPTSMTVKGVDGGTAIQTHSMHTHSHDSCKPYELYETDLLPRSKGGPISNPRTCHAHTYLCFHL